MNDEDCPYSDDISYSDYISEEMTLGHRFQKSIQSGCECRAVI